MGNSISTIRTAERTFMLDGTLDAKNAKALIDLAKAGNAEDKAAVAEIFAHDAFAKGVDPKALLKQAQIESHGASPALEVKLGEGPGLDGKQVGMKAKTVLGDAGGYGSKQEAIATARLSLSPNAVVIEKPEGHFYAAEASGPVTKAAKSVTPIAPIDLKAYEDLKNDKPTKLPEAEKYQKMAAMAFGVPEEMIKVVTDPSQTEAGKINIDLSLKDANGTLNHAAGTCGCHSRLDGKPGAVSLSKGILEAGPMRAATTLFHEGTHASDRDLANSVWKKLPKGFDPDKPKQRAAAYALIDKMKLTPSQKQGLYESLGISNTGADRGKDGGINNHKNVLEARAYAKSVIAAMETSPAGVDAQLVGLAAELEELALKGGTKFKPDSLVFKDLSAEVTAKFHTLPEAGQKQFLAALDGMKDQAFARALKAEVTK